MPNNIEDMKYEDGIFVENIHLPMSNEEKNKMFNLLDKQHIEIICRENKNAVNACLFDAVTVFFNEPLTRKILADLLTMAAYDAIKFAISCFLNNLKHFTLLRHSGKYGLEKKSAQLNVRLKTGNCEMNALIPNNLTHEQNLDYFDRVLKTLVELGKTAIPNTQTYEVYVIDGKDEDKPELLKVKTIIQYGYEQRMKQQNKPDTQGE
jgi:hypothetical protein